MTQWTIRLSLILGVALFVGCSDNNEDNNDKNTPDQSTMDMAADQSSDMMDMTKDAAGDLSKDMSPDLTEDMPEDQTSQGCLSGLSWSAGQAMPEGLTEHSTFITEGQDGAFLHVVGGKGTTGPSVNHHYAKIKDDGSLEAWQKGPDVPNGKSSNAIVRVGDIVYLISGETQGGPNANVVQGKVGANGLIAQWEGGGLNSQMVPSTSLQGTAVYDGTHVSLIGGASFLGAVSSSLHRATVDQSGTFGQWASSMLPTARAEHTSVIYDNKLFLFFGRKGSIFDQGEAINSVDVADLSASPLSFKSFSTSTSPVSLHATTVVGSCAYLFGGYGIANGQLGAPSNAVVMYDLSKTTEDAPQTLSAFQTASGGVRQVPYYKGRFYLVGGTDDAKQPLSRVEIGNLDP